LFPKDVITLGYHAVSDERLDHLRFYSYKNAVQFANDIAFVRARAVPYARVAEHRLRNGPLAANSVLITVDDGFAECHDVIRPILLRYGVDAVFFVTTEFLDESVLFFESVVSLCITAIEGMTAAQVETAIAAAGISFGALRSSPRRQLASTRLQQAAVAADQPPEKRLLLTWLLGFENGEDAELEQACALLGIDPRAYSSRRPIFMTSGQVRQLAADGFTIGAHGLTHRCLEGRSPAEIEREIVASCTRIRELTGQRRVPFAFPYSGLGIDRGILGDILSRNGDLVDLLFDIGWLRRDAGFIVNRVFADEPPSGSETNLPRLLQTAWSGPSAWFRGGAERRSLANQS
jgi:peptidoglycan/xylan/chitin deacetylase (PgdA/CDA1 family)